MYSTEIIRLSKSRKDILDGAGAILTKVKTEDRSLTDTELSTGAESQPVEGDSKPATLRRKGLADYAGFFHVYEGSRQNGQSTQNGERTGDSGIA